VTLNPLIELLFQTPFDDGILGILGEILDFMRVIFQIIEFVTPTDMPVEFEVLRADPVRAQIIEKNNPPVSLVQSPRPSGPFRSLDRKANSFQFQSLHKR
jgi:hypothetical protein